MAKPTTRQAVHKLLNSEDYLLLWLQSGYTKEYRRKLRYLLKKEELSVTSQEEILKRCGFKIAVQQRWEKPENMR